MRSLSCSPPKQSSALTAHRCVRKDLFIVPARPWCVKRAARETSTLVHYTLCKWLRHAFPNKRYKSRHVSNAAICSDCIGERPAENLMLTIARPRAAGLISKSSLKCFSGRRAKRMHAFSWIFRLMNSGGEAFARAYRWVILCRQSVEHAFGYIIHRWCVRIIMMQSFSLAVPLKRRRKQRNCDGLQPNSPPHDYHIWLSGKHDS